MGSDVDVIRTVCVVIERVPLDEGNHARDVLRYAFKPMAMCFLSGFGWFAFRISSAFSRKCKVIAPPYVPAERECTPLVIYPSARARTKFLSPPLRAYP